jgi:hypothetical protein
MAEGVGDDHSGNAPGLEQLVAALDERNVQVPLFPKRLVDLAGEYLLALAAIPVGLFVGANVGRIADSDIESFDQPKHPLRVKEVCGGVLVIGVPRRELSGSGHAQKVLDEREIRVEWLERTLFGPELVLPDPDDATVERRFRRIPEFGGRVLRVAVNKAVEPIRVVSVFFDRQMKGKL